MTSNRSPSLNSSRAAGNAPRVTSADPPPSVSRSSTWRSPRLGTRIWLATSTKTTIPAAISPQRAIAESLAGPARLGGLDSDESDRKEPDGVSPRGDASQTDGRDRASIALAVIGALLAVAAVLLLYARAEIIDEDAFADNAVEALAGRPGPRAWSRPRSSSSWSSAGRPDLIAARPLLEQVVATVVDTGAVPPDLPRGGHGRRTGCCSSRARSNVAFDISDGLEIVRFALQLDQPAARRRDLPKDRRPDAG